MALIDFAWTFPCFVLVRDAQETGTAAPRRFRVFAPDISGDGERSLALFTDRDLADSFCRQVAAATEFEPFGFEEPVALRRFVRELAARFRYAAVDVTPGARVCRRFLISELLDALDEWCADAGEIS